MKLITVIALLVGLTSASYGKNYLGKADLYLIPHAGAGYTMLELNDEEASSVALGSGVTLVNSLPAPALNGVELLFDFNGVMLTDIEFEDDQLKKQDTTALQLNLDTSVCFLTKFVVHPCVGTGYNQVTITNEDAESAITTGTLPLVLKAKAEYQNFVAIAEAKFSSTTIVEDKQDVELDMSTFMISGGYKF